jgi:uncharacterized protein (TIGR03067 family)
MKARLLLLVAAGCLVAADGAKKEDGKQELAKLKGIWTVTSAVHNGQTDDDAKGDTVTFDGDKVTVKAKNGEHAGTCKVDAAKKPKSIDFIPSDGPQKDRTHPGIYEIQGDTLRICFTQPDKTRPTAFESEPGSGAMLISLKRQKP